MAIAAQRFALPLRLLMPLTLVLLLALPASATPCPLRDGQATNASLRVAVGSIAVPKGTSPRTATWLKRAFRDALGEQAGLTMQPKKRARYLLRAVVQRLETHAKPGLVRCALSLTLEERRGGAVRAMLKGRASISEELSERAVQDVMRGAVQAALGPLSRQQLSLLR